MNRSAQDIQNMARRMRRRILDMSLACNESTHLGGGLSIVEIMATLYGGTLRYRLDDPFWVDRDRFILSKGHGVLGLFSALVEAGIISEDVFQTFKVNESDLIAHPVMNQNLGIESSNGSLGQGLSFGVGLAWAARKMLKSHRVFVLLGDGECNEGSVWEAAMSASQFKLHNLIAIVDINSLQSDGLTQDILASHLMLDRWRSFGWDAIEIDGHDVSNLIHELDLSSLTGKPRVILAKTIKGKGFSFMEGNNEWHHNRLTRSFYEQALLELGPEV